MSYADKAVDLGAMFTLDGVDGSTWLDAAGARDATIVGAATVAGPGDGLTTALDLDGVDDFAYIDHEAAFDRGGLTTSFAVWLNLVSNPENHYFSVVWSKGAGNATYRLNGSSSNWNSGQNWWGSSADGWSALTTDKWMMLVAVYDDVAATWSMWRRAEDESSWTVVFDEPWTSQPSANTDPLRAGARGNAVGTEERFAEGLFAGFTMFDAALTEQQRDELFDATFEEDGLALTVTDVTSDSVTLSWS